MCGSKNRTAFLALGLDPRVLVTFSGRRYYQLQVVECLLDDVIVADLVPTDFEGCYPGDQKFDCDYQYELEDRGLNDPVFDEVILPYYEALVYVHGDVRCVRLEVKAISWARCPRVKLVFIC